MNFPVGIAIGSGAEGSGVAVGIGAVSTTGTESGTWTAAGTALGANDGLAVGTRPVDPFGQGSPSLSKGQNATYPGARNGGPPASDTDSFRSRWQAALIAHMNVGGLETQLTPESSGDADLAQLALTATTTASPHMAGTGNGSAVNGQAKENPGAAATALVNSRSVGSAKQVWARMDAAAGAQGGAIAPSGQSSQNGRAAVRSAEADARRSFSAGRREIASQESGAQSTSETATIAPPVPVAAITPVAAQVNAPDLPATPALSSADRSSSETPAFLSRSQELGESGNDSGIEAVSDAIHSARTGAGFESSRKPTSIADGAGIQNEEHSGDLGFSSRAVSLSGTREAAASAAAIESDARLAQQGSSANRRDVETTLSNSDHAAAPLFGAQSGAPATAGATVLDTAAVNSPVATTNVDSTRVGDLGPSVVEAGSRPAHRQTIGDSRTPASQATLGQAHGADASAWPQAPTIVQSATNVGAEPTGLAGGNSATGQAGAARDTFAALDAGTQVGTPTWIHAGGQKAEAGFQDPSLGWVGVQADMSGGSIHASLMPGSAEAAQALSAHLPGLNAYLTNEHAPAANVTVASPSGGLESGAGQNMQQGAGHNAERNAPTESQTSSEIGLGPAERARALAGAAESIQTDPTTRAGDARGRHISVIA